MHIKRVINWLNFLILSYKHSNMLKDELLFHGLFILYPLNEGCTTCRLEGIQFVLSIWFSIDPLVPCINVWSKTGLKPYPLQTKDIHSNLMIWPFQLFYTDKEHKREERTLNSEES